MNFKRPAPALSPLLKSRTTHASGRQRHPAPHNMSSSSNATIRVVRLPATLNQLASLAALLEKLEQGASAPDPGQYQRLVVSILAELQRQAADPALTALLECFPATAELYENANYQAAGLCRAPLERSVQTEQTTRELLQHLARGPSSNPAR